MNKKITTNSLSFVAPSGHAMKIPLNVTGFYGVVVN
jgi:hypothetical protein